MKIGDEIYVLAKKDGTILGDGDGMLMSKNFNDILEERKNSAHFLESLNDCKMSEVTIELISLNLLKMH